ncbi:FAD/NAD(P)-binding domain-containing protein [Cubamyces sp. BRFM 1775]|nr:FAD/NAD(P)-binding domain-containing protein [Cubamyces sp. BRFM 1775]
MSALTALAHDPRSESIVVIGAGVAGLITAHTLLRDGFTGVQLLTRDAHVGGVWSRDHIYPGLYLNNVHGEYRLSPLEMPPPTAGGDRLTGDDMMQYMEVFASKFLEGRIQFNVEVQNIRRHPSGQGWLLDVQDLVSFTTETREYARIVVCTGGCSTPRVPEQLSANAATNAGFAGPVLHSIDCGPRLDDLLASVAPEGNSEDLAPIVVIGGGKSAQDICAYLANEGRKVSMVCPNLDAFTAGPKPLPDFIRKSRLLSLFSPHIHLRTVLERFLHTTWLGKKIVDFMWHGLAESSASDKSAYFQAMNIAKDSALRNAVSPYWHIRVNDEGVPRSNGFHALAIAGTIEVHTPAYAIGYGEDGKSVKLDDGRSLRASAIVLATGYRSSWSPLCDDATAEELGLTPHQAEVASAYHWSYPTLAHAPPIHPDAKKWSSSIYRGLVPAKNIHRRDFAVNGACVSPNNGYTVEVASHWISSYFLADEMRLPKTPEGAFAETERAAAWLKQRYPEIPTALNTSHTGYLAFWTWPQHVDDLLDDMGLPNMRSGGNGLTWPFKVIDSKEIQCLKEERDAKRARRRGPPR